MKDNWQTPPLLFSALNSEFDFTLDGAADASNHLCERWLGPGSEEAEDALTWRGSGERIFCNPPYSQVAKFVAWAYNTAQDLNSVTILVPATTDTKWWHAYVWDEVRGDWYPGVDCWFVKGRIKFIDPISKRPRGTPRFASAVITFTPDIQV